MGGFQEDNDDVSIKGVTHNAIVSPFGALKTCDLVLLQGTPFGSTLDTNIWTKIEGSAATVTVSNSVAKLKTNTTANAQAYLFHKNKAIFHVAHNNIFTAGVRLGDTGVTNNLRAWGIFTGDNGLFFQLNGTTPQLITRNATTDTIITSFNGPKTFVIDTNFHVYDMIYSQGSAYFYQDRELIHTATATTTALYADPHLPLSFANANISGGSSNVDLDIRGASISRFGPLYGQELATRISSNSTTTLKLGAGTLRTVSITNPGLLANTVTLYDNTAGSGTVLAVVSTTSGVGTLNLNIPFNTGLTVVMATGTAANIVVTYE